MVDLDEEGEIDVARRTCPKISLPPPSLSLLLGLESEAFLFGDKFLRPSFDRDHGSRDRVIV